MEDERTQLTAGEQVRIAALNAAIAMGQTSPKKACDIAEKLVDWIYGLELPPPQPGAMW